MTARITIIKNYRNKETLRLVELQELASIIREGECQEAVEKFQSDLPLMPYVYRNDDGSFGGYEDWPKNLPRICFALEQEHRKGERITKGYTGLVLLEVNNLPGDDEAAAVRNGAAEMPQTLMAFVGADANRSGSYVAENSFPTRPSGSAQRCCQRRKTTSRCFMRTSTSGPV